MDKLLEKNNNKIDLSSIQRRKDPDPPPVPKAMDKPVISSMPNFPIANIPKFPHMPKPPKVKKSKPKTNSNDDEKEKNRLLLILNFYLLEFSEKLRSFKGMNFNKMSIEELIDIRNQMDATISSKSNLKQTQIMVTSGIRMIEFATIYATPLKCHGLSDTLIKDPEVLDDIKHIALKRMSNTPIDPEFRLASKVVSNIIMLHNINSQNSTPNKVHKVDESALNDLNLIYNDI